MQPRARGLDDHVMRTFAWVPPARPKPLRRGEGPPQDPVT